MENRFERAQTEVYNVLFFHLLPPSKIFRRNQKCLSVAMINLVILTPVPIQLKMKTCRKLLFIFAVLALMAHFIFGAESSSFPASDPNRCYIVFNAMMMLLFAVCRQCRSKAVKAQKVVIDSYLEMAKPKALDTVPSMKHTRFWRCHATSLE